MPDTCAASSGITPPEYNLPLHVGAVFIILGVSSLACAFPLLAVKFPKLRIPSSVLFTARHFGTGVLIATAFVHLLPTAFLSLGNPCLPKFWTEDYPAMPGAIAMAAMFFVAVAEMVFSRRLGKGLCSAQIALPTEMKVNPELSVRDQDLSGARLDMIEPVVAASGIERLRVAESNMSQNAIRGKPSSTGEDDSDTESQIWQEKRLSPEQKHKKALLQVLLLEMGILFHSVFIGMALSVIAGQDFIILLIAISFHQTFEGLALGSRIAVLNWKDGDWKPWIMAFAYGCTTPIGQAIGLATHTLYAPDSKVGLLMVGIMNAISSGLLIFASLVELLAEDFLSENSRRVLGGKKKTWSACLLVFFGAFLMSLVGAWA